MKKNNRKNDRRFGKKPDSVDVEFKIDFRKIENFYNLIKNKSKLPWFIQCELLQYLKEIEYILESDFYGPHRKNKLNGFYNVISRKYMEFRREQEKYKKLWQELLIREEYSYKGKFVKYNLHA